MPDPGSDGNSRRISRSWIVPTVATISALWLWLAHARDFHVYWAAGRALINGGWESVYRISDLTPFKYHPVFALVFAAFGLLPEAAAKLLWSLANGVMVFDALRRWGRHWGLDPAAIGFGFVALIHALSWQYLFGNVTFAMLWLWTVGLTARSAWREALSYAVLIALKPFWFALVVPWFLGRRFGLLGRVGGMLAALSTAPIVLGIGPLLTAYERWIATFAFAGHAENFPKPDNQSWYALLSRHPELVGRGLTAAWIGGVAAVGFLWLWPWRRVWRDGLPRDRWWHLETSMMPFILWTAPLSWIHHQILLWPLLALAWQRGRSERTARAIFLASFVLLSLLAKSLIGGPATAFALGWGMPLVAYLLLIWWSSARLAEDLPPRSVARTGSAAAPGGEA